jgi:anaerobic selenocysteine-containing dehydrogenase
MGFKVGMRYTKASEIFDEFARVTAGRPNDQSALSHELLRARGPQQWPYPALGVSSGRRFEDGVFPTASGRARLWARPWMPPEETPNAEFPLLLTTGRVSGQWHTRTKTALVAQLNKLDPAPYLQMHPEDAEALRLRDGQRVEIQSRRGRAWSVLRLEPHVTPGVVFMPMHWNDLWSEGASVNEATTDASDPISHQPSLKCCAVAVRPYAAASQAPAHARADADAGSDSTPAPFASL